MYLNHERKSVYQWDAADPGCRSAAYCPECNAPLVAKRGDRVIWHWAHHRRDANGVRCEYESGETDWHLRWKAAYAETGLWLVEARYEVDHPLFNRLRLRFDACLTIGRKVLKVREFVHSLSSSYLHKDAAILADGIDLLWVFDGAEVVSVRRKSVAAGYRRFLKPAALELINQLTGRVLVHFDGRLWKRWKGNVWYPQDNCRYKKMCDLFAQTESQLRPSQQEAA